MYWGNGLSDGWVLFPILMMIVVVIVVLFGMRMFGAMMTGRGGWFNAGPSSDHAISDSALETLRERFARGEIDEQEYEAKRALLGRTSGTR